PGAHGPLPRTAAAARAQGVGSLPRPLGRVASRISLCATDSKLRKNFSPPPSSRLAINAREGSEGFPTSSLAWIFLASVISILRFLANAIATDAQVAPPIVPGVCGTRGLTRGPLMVWPRARGRFILLCGESV